MMTAGVRQSCGASVVHITGRHIGSRQILVSSKVAKCISYKYICEYICNLVYKILNLCVRVIEKNVQHENK